MPIGRVSPTNVLLRERSQMHWSAYCLSPLTEGTNLWKQKSGEQLPLGGWGRGARTREGVTRVLGVAGHLLFPNICAHDRGRFSM